MGYVSKEWLKEHECQIFMYQKAEDGSEGVLPVSIDDLPDADVVERLVGDAKEGIEYDYHTDTTYPVPACPHCGETFFPREEDIGKTFMCGFCKNMITLPDAPWVRKYIDDNTGSREEIIRCSNCGNMTMKIFKHKTNGVWRTYSGRCECGLRFIV